MESSKKMVIFAIVFLPRQQSAMYSYERKWNPRCVASLHCECQELKPKVATNTLFLVLHPFSGVDTVKTVGSHLKPFRPAILVTVKAKIAFLGFLEFKALRAQKNLLGLFMDKEREKNRFSTSAAKFKSCLIFSDICS